MPRARMTRHELKARDEITTKLESFTEIAMDRKKEILIIGGVVVALILAYVGWSAYSNRRSTEAQNQLALAITAYADPTLPSDKARYEKTVAEAQKTLDSYQSLPAGIIARFYLALGQEGLGETTSAVESLQDVIDRGDATTKGVAQFTLAGIYQKHGDAQKAVDTLKQLSDSGGYTPSAVAYELGKALEANKQPDQAKTYYEKVVKEYADSPFRSDAEAGLRRMGFTPPVAAPASANPS